MLNVVSILASPNNNGNTAKLLKFIHQQLKTNNDINLDYFKVNQLNINPCSACEYCNQNQGCIIDDDMGQLYQAFNQADLIFIGSPLYFNSVSAQLKKIIDRCQAAWANKLILKQPLINPAKKRKGYFISTAGQPANKDRFKYTAGTIELFFKAIATKYQDNFFVGNTDQKEVKNQKDLLKKINNWVDQISLHK